MSDSLSPRPLRWLSIALISAVYAASFAAVFWFLWTPLGGRQALGWDMLTEYWGDVAYQAKWIARGDVPLWNPYERLGFPSHADPQAGQFYPLNWLTYPLAWLGGDMPSWSVGLKNWLHLVIAAVGTFAFLWRRGEVAPACWIGGYLFAMSMPLISFTASALMWPICWLPLVWIALDRVFERPDLGRGLELGLLFAMPVLAGNPPSLWYLCIGALFFAVDRLVVGWRARPAERGVYVRRLAIALGAGAVLTLLLGAPALLPVQEVYSHSVRTARDATFVLRTNLTPYKLLGFALPNLSTRGYHYGLITLFFCGVALWRRPREVTWAAALSLFAVLISIGEHGFLLQNLAAVFPPFGLFRGPHRYAVLCSAGIALWAPLGITALWRASEDARRRAAAWLGGFSGVAILGFGITAAVLAARNPKARDGVEVEALALGALLALTCGVIAILIGRRRDDAGGEPRAWAWVAVPATVLALWLGALDAHKGNNFPVPETKRDAKLAQLAYDPLETRLYDDQFLLYRPGVRREVRDVSGYEGDPLGSRRYDDVIKRTRKKPEHLRHLGAGLYLRARHPRLPVRMQGIERNRHFEKIDNDAWRIVGAAPQVYVVPKIDRVKTAKQARDAWLRSEPGQRAFVADEDWSESLAPLVGAATGRATAGRLVSIEPDGLVAEVDSPGGGLAVFVESWFPAWRAFVDDAPAEVHRVNYMLRGVVVPAGKHTVRMVFSPGRFTASATSFGLGLALFAIGFGWTRRQKQASSMPQ